MEINLIREQSITRRRRPRSSFAKHAKLSAEMPAGREGGTLGAGPGPGPGRGQGRGGAGLPGAPPPAPGGEGEGLPATGRLLGLGERWAASVFASLKWDHAGAGSQGWGPSRGPRSGRTQRCLVLRVHCRPGPLLRRMETRFPSHAHSEAWRTASGDSVTSTGSGSLSQLPDRQGTPETRPVKRGALRLCPASLDLVTLNLHCLFIHGAESSPLPALRLWREAPGPAPPQSRPQRPAPTPRGGPLRARKWRVCPLLSSLEGGSGLPPPPGQGGRLVSGLRPALEARYARVTHVQQGWPRAPRVGPARDPQDLPKPPPDLTALVC